MEEQRSGPRLVRRRRERGGSELSCRHLHHQPDLLSTGRIQHESLRRAFGGFGDVRSSLYVIRLPIGLSGSAPDGWSWGIALAPSIGRNLFTPAAFAAPSLGANGHPLYATVQQEDIRLGFGAQAGLRWQVEKDLSFGLSLSSPTWFQTYSWIVTDGSGNPHTINFEMNRPLTAQLGANYAVAENTHILADLGYIAYGSTKGFENSGFRP